MRPTATRRGVITSIGAGTVLLAGCTGDESSPEEDGGDGGDEGVDPGDYQYEREEPDDESAARDSTLLVTQDLERAEEFDPVISNGAYSQQVWENIYDRLYEPDDGLSLEPKVATSMPDVERDGTRFLFEIHEGIEFHNGDPLTAGDVAHSFTAPVEEETDHLPNYVMIDSIDVVDDHQLQVDLQYPYGRFQNELMGIPIVPEDARTADREAFLTNPIGSGPFEWSDFEYNEYVELTRFEDYWDDPKPFVQRVRFETAADRANRVAQIRSDDTDVILGVPDPDWPVLEDEEGVRSHMAASLGFHFVAFNCRDGAITSDPDVRRGVFHSFSVPDFVETNLPNTGQLMLDPFGPAINEEWDFPADEWAESYPSYDTERAQELLDGAVPDDWSPTVTTTPGIRADLAEEIALRLGEIGYDAEVRTVDLGPMIGEIIEGDPDTLEIWLFGMAGGADPDNYIYNLMHESKQGAGVSPFYDGSDSFQDNIERARQSVDQDERRELYVEIYDEMLENAPLLPAFDTYYTMASREHVRDLHVHPNVRRNPRLVSEYGNVWVED